MAMHTPAHKWNPEFQSGVITGKLKLANELKAIIQDLDWEDSKEVYEAMAEIEHIVIRAINGN